MIFIIWELGYGYILGLEDTIHPITHRKGRASVYTLIFKTLEWKARNRHIKRPSHKNYCFTVILKLNLAYVSNFPCSEGR